MIDPADIPDKPMTLTIIPMVEVNDDPNVFAFLCVFPSGTKFTLDCRFPAGVVDTSPKMAAAFAGRIVEALGARGDEVSIATTNWTSVAAMMQKLLIDFNNRRAGKAIGTPDLLGPDGRVLH